MMPMHVDRATTVSLTTGQIDTICDLIENAIARVNVVDRADEVETRRISSAHARLIEARAAMAAAGARSGV